MEDTLTAAEQQFHETKGASGLPEEVVETPIESDKPTDKPVEQKTEEKADKPADKEPEVQKLVPHGAFEEERQRRKAADARAANLEKELARLQGMQDALNQGKKPADMTPQEKADWDKDPIAAGKAIQARLDAEEKAREEAKKTEAEYRRVSGIASRHAEAFAQTNPHFRDSVGPDGKPVQGAYSYLREKAFQALRAQNPNDSDEQITAAVNLHELSHTLQCLHEGSNAAEQLWKMAVEQGYKAPEKPKEEAKGPSEAERIKALEEAQRASASLSNAHGGGGDGEPTLKNIADMTDEEFAQIPKAKLRKMMGG